MSTTSTAHGKPTDGMCCFCTMEDITEEDGNYGECFSGRVVQCSVVLCCEAKCCSSLALVADRFIALHDVAC